MSNQIEVAGAPDTARLPTSPRPGHPPSFSASSLGPTPLQAPTIHLLKINFLSDYCLRTLVQDVHPFQDGALGIGFTPLLATPVGGLFGGGACSAVRNFMHTAGDWSINTIELTPLLHILSNHSQPLPSDLISIKITISLN